MDDIDKREAELLARLEAEREQRLAEKIAAGEIVSVPLCIVAGSESEARARVEQAKADKLAELRAAGDQREVMFTVELIVTGVCRHGEATVSGEPWKPTAPPYLPGPARRDEVVEEEAVREEPRPRSSRPTCKFKSANATMTTIPGKLPKGGLASTTGL